MTAGSVSYTSLLLRSQLLVDVGPGIRQEVSQPHALGVTRMTELWSVQLDGNKRGPDSGSKVNPDLEQSQAQLIAVVKQILSERRQALAVEPGPIRTVQIGYVGQPVSAREADVASGNTLFMSIEGGQVDMGLPSVALARGPSEGDRVMQRERELGPLDFQDDWCLSLAQR